MPRAVLSSPVALLASVLLNGASVACAAAPALPLRAAPPAADLVPAARWERLEDPAALGWDLAGLAAAKRTWSDNSGTSAVIVIWRGAVVDQWGDVGAKWTVRSIRKSMLSGLLAEPVADGRSSRQQHRRNHCQHGRVDVEHRERAIQHVVGA